MVKLRLRSSLLLRAFLAGIAVTALVSLIAVTVAGRIAHRREMAHQREVLEALLDVVEPSASAACFVEDQALAQEVVRGLVQTPAVRAASLRSGNVVLAQASRPGPAGEDPEGAAIARRLSSPFSPGTTLGELVVMPDLRASELQAGRTVRLVQTVVMLMAIALALALEIGRAHV